MQKTSACYELEVELLDVEPAVWRRLRVPSTLTFDQLHVVIQEAFGWEDVHLYMFQIAGVTFGPPLANTACDSASTRLCEVLKPGLDVWYVYDFGDYWQHAGYVLGLTESGAPIACLEGRNTAPPEDSGGPGSRRGRRSSHKFDLAEVNRRLGSLHLDYD